MRESEYTVFPISGSVKSLNPFVNSGKSRFRTAIIHTSPPHIPGPGKHTTKVSIASPVIGTL